MTTLQESDQGQAHRHSRIRAIPGKQRRPARVPLVMIPPFNRPRGEKSVIYLYIEISGWRHLNDRHAPAVRD